MTHGSLFSGIDGFSFAAEAAGIQNVFQVEIDKKCRVNLAMNFPSVTRYGDIKKFNGRKYEGKIDILTGGFPCQPFSIAGQGKGSADDRFLWPEMFRCIREIKPHWIVAENSPRILTIENGMVFKLLQSNLESEGYQVLEPLEIPVTGVGAPHLRYRAWIIAYNNSLGRRSEPGSIQGREIIPENERFGQRTWNNSSERNCSDADNNNNRQQRQCFSGENQQELTTTVLPYPAVADNNCKRKLQQCKFQSEGRKRTCDANFSHANDNEIDSDFGGFGASALELLQEAEIQWQKIPHVAAVSELCRMAPRIPHRVHRIGSMGNAIVPQIAFRLFRAIIETENQLLSNINERTS